METPPFVNLIMSILSFDKQDFIIHVKDAINILKEAYRDEGLKLQSVEVLFNVEANYKLSRTCPVNIEAMTQHIKLCNSPR